MNLNSCIVFSDPELVSEIFIAKNKYFDKHPKFGNVQKRLIGDSIIFSPSNDLWAKKKKSISSAFYKDKLTKMMQICIRCTLDFFKTWEDNKVKIIDITTEPLDLLTNCI